MTVKLIVGGEAFETWTDVSLRYALESLAQEFSLNYVSDEGEISIPVGESCEIKTLDDLSLLRGFVDEVDETYDGGSHQLSCSGRSESGDLVDCSAVVAGGQWRNTTLQTIIADLLRPYGQTFYAEGVDPTTNVRQFAVQEGETVHECLERLGKVYGFLVSAGPSGGVAAVTPGSRRTETVIERGVNVARGQYHSSILDRFSEYSVVAQQSGDANIWGKSAAHVRATVKDDGVGRHRPFRIIAEAQMSRAEAEKRAKLERNVRYGRSERWTYEVITWRTKEGVWTPNQLVTVRDAQLRVDEELLISAVELSFGDDGELAVLELVRPEAYDVTVVPPKKSSSQVVFR